MLSITKTLMLFTLAINIGFVIPIQSHAAMIDTQGVYTAHRSLSAQIVKQMDNPKISSQLKELGVSPQEAKARIKGLSDAEIQAHLQSDQAGGDVVVVSLTTILLVIIIVLLID